MSIRFSLLFVLTVVIAVLIKVRHKHEGLTVFEFILCGLWGFLLHESSFAPTVHDILNAFSRAIGR